MKTKKVTLLLLVLLCLGIAGIANGRNFIRTFTPLPGDTSLPCPVLSAPVVNAAPHTISPGYSSYLTVNASGMRALVVFADTDDGGVTAYLNADPRFSLADVYDARYGTPSLSTMLEYDVVITWGNYPYEFFSAPGPEYNNVTIGNNLKAYVDAGGGVLICSFGHDNAPDMYFGIGGDFRTYNYNPIQANIAEYVYGTVNFGDVTYSAHPIVEGVSAVYTDHYYATNSLSDGAVAIFSWNEGYLGGAVKNVGNGRVAALNQSPTADGGGDENLLIANAAAWAAYGVEWYERSCMGTPAGTGNPLQVTPGLTTDYYAHVSNICGSVSDCGSVTVTVSDENGYDNTMLCSYVALAYKEVKLEGIAVNSGGVGATKPGDGKVEAKKNTSITAESTFASAARIVVDPTSVVTERNYTPADIVLPNFEMNQTTSTYSVNIPENATMILSDPVYREVKVGKNATVVFTGNDICAHKIILEDNATVNFMQAAKVRLRDGIPSGKNISVNTLGMDVVFYIDHDLEFKEGANITGVFYLGKVDHGTSKLKHKLTIRESKIERPGIFNGMFLAEVVEAKKNNSFNILPNTAFCADIQPKIMMEYENISMTQEDEISVRCYPNPFSDKLNFSYNLNQDDYVTIRIFDVSGKHLITLMDGPAEAGLEYNIEFDGTDLPAGVYYYRMSTLSQSVSGKLIRMK